ncbi:MAG: RNA polymerase subunit sigma-24 [Saprospiraceae bacterium]|nr:MAG: RNA polymerase subunit sigma-24 [Saprospiraceae bacterium]
MTIIETKQITKDSYSLHESTYNLDPEEAELVVASIKGDQRAAHRLYCRYVQAMYHTVIRMIPRVPEAEDVLQDAFVQVFHKLHTFKGDSSLGAWIKRICINMSLNYLRTAGRMSFVALEDHDFSLSVSDPNDGQADFPLDLKTIHQTIKELPEGCRVVFNLHLLEGYQHQEVAEILNISVSTSKTQYRRARHLLSEKLKAKL